MLIALGRLAVRTLLAPAPARRPAGSSGRPDDAGGGHEHRLARDGRSRRRAASSSPTGSPAAADASSSSPATASCRRASSGSRCSRRRTAGSARSRSIVDHNKLQSDTWVSQVSDLGDLEAKVASFGWAVARCDGHDLASLLAAARRARSRGARAAEADRRRHAQGARRLASWSRTTSRGRHVALRLPLRRAGAGCVRAGARGARRAAERAPARARRLRRHVWRSASAPVRIAPPQSTATRRGVRGGAASPRPSASRCSSRSTATCGSTPGSSPSRSGSRSASSSAGSPSRTWSRRPERWPSPACCPVVPLVRLLPDDARRTSRSSTTRPRARR